MEVVVFLSLLTLNHLLFEKLSKKISPYYDDFEYYQIKMREELKNR